MVWVVAGVALLLAAGVAAGWLSWRRERAEVRRLGELLRFRADQVSMLSHELRTPLTLVKLSGDLLAEGGPGPLTGDQAKFVDTIRQQADATISLAEDMLTQARLESGTFTLHLTYFDVADLVLDLIANLRAVHGPGLIADCPTTPIRLYGDALLLRQALTNLVNNAVAVNPPGAAVLVRLVRRDDDVLVSVTDQGTGMTAEQRLNLFRRFASGRPVRSGTGLGLIITREIVARHGGHLFVDTVWDRGTTMMLNLPIRGPEVLSHA